MRRLSRAHPIAPHSVVKYMEGLQEVLESAQAIAQHNHKNGQDQQKHYYDWSAEVQRFSLGDHVLVRGLMLGPWARPFPVTRILGPCTYEVQGGPRTAQRRVIHINQLKGWVGPPQADAQVLAELCVDAEAEGGGWDTDPSVTPD